MTTQNAEEKIFLCASDDLWERGRGIRFDVATPGGPECAFAVRFEGKPFAYLNRCMHLPQELDWNAGEFFDDESQYIVCASHGALYRPQDGTCVAGPCRGARLIAVPVEENAQGVFWIASERVRPIAPVAPINPANSNPTLAKS
jgi:nitrite reductase/ring-hydroxylating ferredoxin subunit